MTRRVRSLETTVQMATTGGIWNYSTQVSGKCSKAQCSAIRRGFRGGGNLGGCQCLVTGSPGEFLGLHRVELRHLGKCDFGSQLPSSTITIAPKVFRELPNVSSVGDNFQWRLSKGGSKWELLRKLLANVKFQLYTRNVDGALRAQ